MLGTAWMLQPNFLGDLVHIFVLSASTAQFCVIDSDGSGNCGMLRYGDVHVSCYLQRQPFYGPVDWLECHCVMPGEESVSP